MGFSKWKISIFPQELDRRSFAAYFMGGIVPLSVLGAVVERYALSPVAAPASGYFAVGLLGLVGSMCLLSLSSYFILRRLVRQSLEKSRVLAYYDSLTGLPSRRLFKDRLAQALLQARRRNRLLATCFLDLDGFKRVNDTLGHSGGDQLLRQVAKRMVKSLRSGDSVARANQDEPEEAVSRLGGDEFTFLLKEIPNPQAAADVAWRLLESLRIPFEIDSHEVFATASIGIAVFPFDGNDAETLLKNADTAMYSAKDRGRNNYQFYAESMNTAAKSRLDLERRLRRAVENEELSLHYQPLRDAVSGRLSGAEALLRWNDPERGSVSPAEFIPVAEETGLILQIGEWVLRTACAQVQAWQAQGYQPIRIAVNLSGHQLRQPAILAKVAQALEDTALSPAHLELEITESTIMQDDAVTVAAFKGLDEMGIGLALDDFGTGYSSLSYLRRFPISRVKIDRSFVSGIPGDPDDTALAASIIALAHSLRMKVVGEGVETLEQAEFLRDSGCDELQGFLFSPAVPAEEFVRFLQSEKPD
jgi:diguanylate cyclase (GGDEF)-like protein